VSKGFRLPSSMSMVSRSRAASGAHSAAGTGWYSCVPTNSRNSVSGAGWTLICAHLWTTMLREAHGMPSRQACPEYELGPQHIAALYRLCLRQTPEGHAKHPVSPR